MDSSSPDTSFCLGDTNYVGPDDNTLLNFDVTDNLPSHIEVLQANVVMGISSQSSTTPEEVGVWQAGTAWTNDATWNTSDGSTSWATPGGDTTGSMLSEQNIGASGDTGNDVYWDIDSTMQDWIDGDPSQVDGLIFKATDGSSAPNTLGFNTETSSTDAPYIGVYYEPRMGDFPGAKYDTQQLTDRSSLGVNAGTGNLLVSNTDLNLTGINGLNVNVGRYYNNLSGDQNAFGVGWSMGTGADTYLAIPSDVDGVVDYFDGTGNAELFRNNNGTWSAPPGEDARLTMNGSGTWDSTEFTLHFRHSGMTETFDAPGSSEDKVARLASLKDRDGNTITYSYNSSNQLTSIVDSYGNASGGTPSAHTTTISWSPEGYISEITDPTGRQYQYFQNANGQLTQYKDPDGNTTTYAYDSFGNLTQITTAAGDITTVSYDAGNTNEVMSVQRMQTPSDLSSPTSNDPLTTYQFATASGTCQANPGWTQGTVRDPNGHVSTYCTDALSRIRKVIDANGHSRSTDYSDDGFISSQTAPSNMSTAFTYSQDDKDNVTAITQTNSTGSGSPGPLTTSLGYTDPTNPYYPTTAKDPQNHSFGYTYDSSGNLHQVQGATAGDPTNGDGVTIDHNSDGTVKDSSDANNNQTTYGYTNGNLTTVTPPSGSGLNQIHLSYDSANRVIKINSISGSSGHEVCYTYDDFDHVASATYKNPDGSTAEQVTYGYDTDGNLTRRTDSTGTTAYGYDGLNRMTSEWFPNGSSTQFDYDPASNLAHLFDASGETTYTYDKANQLLTVTDPGATKPTATMTYNTDGKRTGITYASGASVIYGYNTLDQLNKVTDNYKTSSGTATHLSYAYGYNGSLQGSVTDQAGNQTSYSYDGLNRLRDATTANGATTQSDYNYTLDKAGNITQIKITGTAVPNSTTSYAYNSGNQICWSASGSQTPDCGSPPSGANSYTYDGDGNQTSNGNGLTATYNALGQTTSITSAGTTTNYSYLGESQTELVSDGSTSIENDLLGIDSTTNATGTATYYTRAPDGTILDQRTPSGTDNYLYDGNNNVVGLTDSSDHLANQYSYDPYGNKTTTTSTVTNPFGYQSGYTLGSGLTHFGARYLNSTDARWTQQDPLDHINDLTQADRYAYSGDDPVNGFDPSGMSLWSDFTDGVDQVVEGTKDFVEGCVAGGEWGGYYGSFVADPEGGATAGCLAGGFTSVVLQYNGLDDYAGSPPEEK